MIIFIMAAMAIAETFTPTMGPSPGATFGGEVLNADIVEGWISSDEEIINFGQVIVNTSWVPAGTYDTGCLDGEHIRLYADTGTPLVSCDGGLLDLAIVHIRNVVTDVYSIEYVYAGLPPIGLSCAGSRAGYAILMVSEWADPGSPSSLGLPAGPSIARNINLIAETWISHDKFRDDYASCGIVMGVNSDDVVATASTVIHAVDDTDVYESTLTPLLWWLFSCESTCTQMDDILCPPFRSCPCHCNRDTNCDISCAPVPPDGCPAPILFPPEDDNSSCSI